MSPSSDLSQEIEDLNLLSKFLARRDPVEERFDCIVLLGSGVLETVELVAKSYKRGISNRILISGGIGHSTKELWLAIRASSQFSSIAPEGKPEALILQEILVDYYAIPAEAILIEDQSTNCGANAYETRKVLELQGIEIHRIFLIQDPTMQLRSHLSFERAWRGESDIQFASFAPFVPKVLETENGIWDFEPHAWARERFLSLILGEIPRLSDTPSGYGPSGKDFIEHVDIPEIVMRAYDRLGKRYESEARTI